jgi:hypothetical protein
MDVGFNDTARTVAAASRSYLEIDKEHRPASGTTYLVKFTCRATEGLKTKFRLMSLSWKEDDQLDTVYSIGLLIVDLTKHLTRFDMVDVFERVLLPTSANNDKGVLSMRSLVCKFFCTLIMYKSNNVHIWIMLCMIMFSAHCVMYIITTLL